MDNTAASVKAFSRKQRCGLGAVEFGRRLLPFLTASGMMSYMLEGMEVSGSGVWMIMMAALIVSSLTVFILSFMMDRTRKRSGRSKPWIYSGILLLAVSVLMSMHVPGNAMGARLVYAGIVLFVWSSSVKLLLYPADALIAGMTADAAERWNLASVKGIAGSLAAICAVFPAGRLAAPGIMGADGGKRYVAVFTVLIIIAMLTGSFLLRERNLPRIPESQGMSLINCAEDLKAFLTNRYFLILLVYGGLLMFGTSVFATLTGEYSFWILSETGNTVVMNGIRYGVPLAAFLAVLFLNRKLTKKQCALLGTGIYAAACLLMLVSMKIQPVYYPAFVLGEIGNGFMWAMLWAMEPDVFDHVDYMTGRARAVFPVVFIAAAVSLGSGLAGAVRQSLAGFVMNQQNFAGLAEASIRADGLKQLAVLGFMVIPLVVCGVMALVLRGYGLDEEYGDVRMELDRRGKRA